MTCWWNATKLYGITQVGAKRVESSFTCYKFVL